MTEEGDDYNYKTYDDQWHQGSSRGLVHLPYQRGRTPLPSPQSPPLYISTNYDISITYNVSINIKCSKKQRGTHTGCRIQDQPYNNSEKSIYQRGSQKRDLYCLSHPRSARLVTGPTSGESRSLFSLHVTRIRLAPEHYKHPNNIFVHAWTLSSSLVLLY